MTLNTKAKVNIISFVPKDIFKNVPTGDFTEKEKQAAQKDELTVFTDCMGDLANHIDIKIVRAMD